jgi:hypothetical protein
MHDENHTDYLLNNAGKLNNRLFAVVPVYNNKRYIRLCVDNKKRKFSVSHEFYNWLVAIGAPEQR